jgi:hypothetical protein
MPANITGVAVDSLTVLSRSRTFASLEMPPIDHSPESDNSEDDFIRDSNDSAIVTQRQRILLEAKGTVQKPRMNHGPSRTSDFIHGTVVWLRQSTGFE